MARKAMALVGLLLLAGLASSAETRQATLRWHGQSFFSLRKCAGLLGQRSLRRKLVGFPGLAQQRQRSPFRKQRGLRLGRQLFLRAFPLLPRAVELDQLRVECLALSR